MSGTSDEGWTESIWYRTDLQISCLCLLQGPRSIALWSILPSSISRDMELIGMMSCPEQAYTTDVNRREKVTRSEISRELCISSRPRKKLNGVFRVVKTLICFQRCSFRGSSGR